MPPAAQRGRGPVYDVAGPLGTRLKLLHRLLIDPDGTSSSDPRDLRRKMGGLGKRDPTSHLTDGVGNWRINGVKKNLVGS